MKKLMDMDMLHPPTVQGVWQVLQCFIMSCWNNTIKRSLTGVGAFCSL